MKKFLTILFFLPFQNLFCQDAAGKNIIIYQLSPFCSGSTALLRSFSQNNDFAIFNEPTIELCSFLKPPSEKELIRSEELKKNIFSSQNNHRVYIKDISLTALEFMLYEPEFLQMPEVKFIILVRNPYDTLVSLSKKADPARFGNDFVQCYLSLIRFHELFIKKNLHKVNRYAIVLSEKLFAKPEQHLKKLYNQFGLSFHSNLLHWDSKDSSFDSQEWHNTKDRTAFLFWHKEALESSGFKPLTINKPSFEHFKKEHKKMIKALYKKSLPYYQALIQAYTWLKNENRS